MRDLHLCSPQLGKSLEAFASRPSVFSVARGRYYDWNMPTVPILARRA